MLNCLQPTTIINTITALAKNECPYKQLNVKYLKELDIFTSMDTTVSKLTNKKLLINEGKIYLRDKA